MSHVDNGELPQGWAWATLSEIGEVVSGGTPSTKNEEYWGGDVAWVTPADLSGYEHKTIERGERNLTKAGLAASSAVLMPAGAVLFSSRAPVGYVVIASGPVATNQGFKSLVPASGVSSSFVYYYLKASKKLAESYASGTTFKELSGKRFKQIPLPLAPLSEQHRIVDKIEELCSDLDAGEAALAKTERLLERYRQSVLKAAVEGALTREWREQNPAGESADELLERILEERRARWEADQLAKYEAKGKKPPAGWKNRYKPPAGVEAEELPELPERWRWVSIEQIGDIETGATPKRGYARYWSDGTIPWVTSGALNDEFVAEASDYVAPAALEETNIKLFPAHTLLVAMYGEGKTRGKVSELLIEATTNQACAAVIVPEMGALRKYAKLFLLKNYDDVRRLSSGGVQPNLNLGIIRGIMLGLPPLAEQEAIVDEVERLLSVLDAVAEEVSRQRGRAKQLRRAILQHAFEGRLVPQDPEDEPAEVLLERIRAEKNGKAPPHRSAGQATGKKRGRKGGWKVREGVQEVKVRLDQSDS